MNITEQLLATLRRETQPFVMPTTGRLAWGVDGTLRKAKWLEAADLLDRLAWRHGMRWESDATRASVAASPCAWASTWFRLTPIGDTVRTCSGARGRGRKHAAKGRRAARAREAFQRSCLTSGTILYEDMPISLALMDTLARSVRGEKGDRLGPYERGVRPGRST